MENLKNYYITSPSDPVYNCIAWAAGRMDKWWWPHRLAYWPLSKRGDESVQSFEDAFRTLGYHPCPNGELEIGVEKVAIYAKFGKVKHMARQEPIGWWTSKLGKENDILHPTLAELEGTLYGKVVGYMQRIRVAPAHQSAS